MSFRLFIYYCALAGGWAAFLTWALVQVTGVAGLSSIPLRAAVTAGLLGAGVAAAVAFVDSLVSAAGKRPTPRILVCGALGLGGGAVGGVAGQLLNERLGVPLVVGWALTGVLIGASLGAYDVALAGTPGSRRKLANGVLGGLAGGLVGGLPFALLASSPALARSGLAIGLVVLGGSIGLMIGLAQVVLKEAWLRVEEGFRPGRELLLTRDETTLGRAESCDLGLFGDAAVERLHARIVRGHNRYLLAHAADGGETLVNGQPLGRDPVPLRAGDAIQIGNSVLRFGERQKRR
jgi:hypothetical protein